MVQLVDQYWEVRMINVVNLIKVKVNGFQILIVNYFGNFSDSLGEKSN